MKRAPNSRRGFTLVELMVSLVAGLIVTIAVVGLARAATTTFFEAARISSVESTVRSASERLRQDLSRAGYMSTGNIKLATDQAGGIPLAHRIAVINPTSPGPNGGSRYTTLNDLQGVHIVVGGSGANAGSFDILNAGTAGPFGMSAKNGLNPDAIVLGGNYTTDDSYKGTLYDTGGTCSGGRKIVLDAASDAAVRRLTNTAVPLASLRAAFQPVPPRRFGARVVDGRGCQHYVVVCAVAITGSGAEISIEQDAVAGPAVLPAGQTTCGAGKDESVTINPVNRVRWFVGPNTNPALDPAADVEAPGSKFNLYRDFLDAESPPAPVNELRQIVAEFAVDLKFGIAVADSTNALQIFEMDTDPGGGPIATWTQDASLTSAGGPAPQRVRSVRFRIATRAAVADRRNNLVVGPPPYLTRYCTENAPLATCTKFSRVRTVVSEVALLNQMGMTY